MNSERQRFDAQESNGLENPLSQTAQKRLAANKLPQSAKAISKIEPQLNLNVEEYKSLANTAATAEKNNYNIGAMSDQYPKDNFEDIVDGNMHTAAIEGKGGKSRKLRNKKYKKTRKNKKRTTKRKHSNKKSKQTKSKKLIKEGS